MEKDRSVLPVVLIRGHAVISAVVVWLTVGSAFSPIILPVSAAEPPVETSREKKLDPATLEFVTEKVQPLLATRCLKCHSGDKDDLKGNLSLNSRAAMLAGGDSGPSIVPGAPDKSLLIDAINWRGDYEMPAKSRMPPGEIAILTRWVKMGAPWSDAGKAAVVTHSSFPLESRRAEHWAWQPIGHHEPPKTENSDWPLRGVDHFVLAGLEAAGLTIAPAAERSVLLRRVYFDLIGLPPTPNEVTEFLEDKMPTRQALAAVADRLLESSHFGERWARHWLDLMRYAESRGHEFDHTAPNAHHYRDYVIRAINADLPYNRFVTEHVAGDLLDPPRLHPEHGFNESVLATGAWYLGEWIHSPTDIRQDEADRIDGVIDTVGKAFLGITIACARCHDHKFDAISARDYYGLAGYLQSSRYRQVRFDSMVHNQWVADSLWKLRKQHETDLRTRLAASTKQAVDHWADYLLAARELVAKERSAGNLQEDASFVGAVATAHKLDAGNLKRLVGHLKSVKEQPSDPLHLWALAACENGATDNNAALAAIRHAAEQIRTEDSGSSDFWNEIRIVVDYSTLAAGQWNQDGYAFGSGPQRPGDIRLISDSDGNLVSIATSGAARRDLLWKGLNLAEGTQTEPGALGSLQRSGQTLCTPTFSIESGTLQYLIRGTAKVQAVVDSHRLIAGPLHGGLIRTVKAGSTLKWVSHPLDRYVGHRAHLEFVPEGDEDFELLMVADSKSRLPLPQPIRICAQVAMGETTENVRSLAIALQELFGATHRGLADGSLMEPG
ncbi:MAG: DUF1549 domain-containing protein [Fuerstiella sp.]|nr:DUF1549 domain-containing protein [Fuerstiella sp.]